MPAVMESTESSMLVGCDRIYPSVQGVLFGTIPSPTPTLTAYRSERLNTFTAATAGKVDRSFVISLVLVNGSLASIDHTFNKIFSLRWITSAFSAIVVVSKDGNPLVASLVAVITVVILHLFLRQGCAWFMPLWWCEDKLSSTRTDTLGRNANSSSSVPDQDGTGEIPPKTKEQSASVVAIDAQDKSSWFSHIYWKSPKTLFEDILTMGNCLAGGPGTAMIIEEPDGDEKAFHGRYIEDRVLGEGEFGVVRLVLDMREKDESKNTMACKVLRKGVVFKDNTIYAPLKPEILMGEVEMLRTLKGEHFCMKLMNVYETGRAIFMVTEYCGGGELMEYVSKQSEDLRTDDVSRIAFQMLDAVNHCAQHNIVHRDIKPENIMFQSPGPGSDLRLIDFGSGTSKVIDGFHTTFAGSAFYISPEMFQRTYSYKTDVWSVGVTLYVLVAGFPADLLQRAFNQLQSTNRNLRELPNMPDNMPDSFYDMLEGLLEYRHKKRKSAGDILDHEFVQFHKHAGSFQQLAMQASESEDQATALPVMKMPFPMGRTTSVSLRGSVGRHSLFLDYQKYQRSFTTLLATLLNKKELAELMKVLSEFLSNDKGSEAKQEDPDIPGTEGADKEFPKKLEVMHMRELKTLLKQQKHEQVLTMVDKLPGSIDYDNFAYNVSLLKYFLRDDEGENLTSSMRSGGGRKKRLGSGLNNGSLRSSMNAAPLRGSFRGGSRFGRKPVVVDGDDSIHSVGSVRGRQKVNRTASIR